MSDMECHVKTFFKKPRFLLNTIGFYTDTNAFLDTHKLSPIHIFYVGLNVNRSSTDFHHDLSILTTGRLIEKSYNPEFFKKTTDVIENY